MNKIKKFYDYYWKKFGNNNLSPKVYERDEVFSKIFHQNEKVLDLACGNGQSSKLISLCTKSLVYGLDFSQEAVLQARENGIKAFCGNVEEKLPFKTGDFDSVFWGDNIEHILFPELTVKEIYRILKKDGKLIISCPNMAYWRYRLYYFINGCLPDTEFNGQLPWEWSHIRFFNLPIIIEFLNKNGFEVNKSWGINRRKVDKQLVKWFPNLCGMILVVEAKKKNA